MSSINSISVEKLGRLIGTPKCPVLIDVRTDEDFGLSPNLLPGSVRRGPRDDAEWTGDLGGRHAVVICQKGQKLSHGTAALLRVAGASADTLEGGFVAWQAAKLPLVPAAKLPPRDQQGRTRWVTRERPKVDRIACPWLVRRFVDSRAVFMFVAPAEVEAVGEKFAAAPFDIEGVFWSHRGGLCTFDVMIEETRPCHAAAATAGHHRARCGYGAAGSCTGSAGPVGGIARPVAHVCRRSRTARGRVEPV